MDNSVANHAPLIPMSEMFLSGTDKNARKPMEQDKKESLSYALELIDAELASLNTIQCTNNEEIKKRLTDIQSLRENNLVVVGAIGGLKKIKEKL